ncbi:MAG: hypothetical protein M3N51_09345 [Actinomycetota bacterium]|nr:hypothetical protein [Actinomycetota bacterium]
MNAASAREGQQGSALLEVIVIGFLVVLTISQAMIAAGRLQSAGEAATEAAQAAALEAARYGDEGTARNAVARLLPTAVPAVARRGDQMIVEVRLAVPLTGPVGDLQLTVLGRATARISPYRSSLGR